MAEFTLYGLPMWSVTLPGGGVAPASRDSRSRRPHRRGAADAVSARRRAQAGAAPLAVVTDPATGLEAETFTLDPIANHASTRHATGDGSYWSGPDGVQVDAPAADPAEGVRRAHGHDRSRRADHRADARATTTCIDPVFARPIVDLDGERAASSLRRRRVPVAAAGGAHVRDADRRPSSAWCS